MKAGPRSFAALLATGLDSDEEVTDVRAAIGGFIAAGAPEIWVLSPSSDAARRKLGALPSSIRFFEIATRRALLERARLINRLATELDTDLLWVHDCSVLLPLSDIAARLASSVELTIHPFAALRRLARAESAAWRASKAMPPNEEAAAAAPFGKASFIIERQSFLALGGLSEAFIGVGDEGLELARRSKHFFGAPVTYDHRAFQLWSPRKNHDVADRKSNKDLHQRLTTILERDVEHYVTTRLETSLPVDLSALSRLSRASQRAAAFRVTEPTPPPVIPASLPGTIWGVTALFNPAGYRSKQQNFEQFRARLAKAGLPLLAIELAFDDAPFELHEQSADRVIRLRGGGVLWQKERLLNVAIRQLPAECDKVVWLDADILFEEPDWVLATSRLLERFVVAQPFSRSARLLPGEASVDIDELPVGSGEHEVLHGMAYGVAAKGPTCLSRYLEHGHCGYAWAARRSVLAKHGLYDANILGNGDLNTAHAMFGGDRYLKTGRLSERAASHLSRWANAFYEDVQGSVGYLDGTIYHLWHGQKADRRYIDRLEVLIEHDYDPERDLSADGGAYRWASDKPVLHAICGEYFTRRREDG